MREGALHYEDLSPALFTRCPEHPNTEMRSRYNPETMRALLQTTSFARYHTKLRFLHVVE